MLWPLHLTGPSTGGPAKDEVQIVRRARERDIYSMSPLIRSTVLPLQTECGVWWWYVVNVVIYRDLGPVLQ